MVNSNLVVLLFVGYSCTGKSSIIEQLGVQHKLFSINTSSVIRRLSSAQGFTHKRDWISSLGVTTAFEITTRSVIDEITAIASSESENIVIAIDGCYDSKFPVLLCEKFPAATIWVIIITTEKRVRESRMAQRGGLSLEKAKLEINSIDRLKEDAGINTLISQADITVHNTASTIEDIVLKLAQELTAKGVWK